MTLKTPSRGVSAQTEPTTDGSAPKLALPALTALVVGSMIGGGIFGLPSQMASKAGPGPMLVGWLVTGLGMLMLAFTFQVLARRKPEVDGGVYGYARAGFGDYVGYSSAWGYWLSAWIGNIGYFVLLFASLGYFFPTFGNGATLTALIGASALLWCIHFLVFTGVQQAALVNTVVTVAKVVPLLTFVVILLFAFDADLFTADFWGEATRIDGAPLGTVLGQVKEMMLITVWVFIGIEGASIYSKRALRRSDVGRATIMGFAGVLLLLVSVNVLSFAAMQRVDIAALEDPSTAGVLREVVGPWGAGFISLGLVISLLGALLSWVLLSAEILQEPAHDDVLPRGLGHMNKVGAPTGALWLTSLCMQAMLVWNYFSEGSYEYLLILATSLILLPYLWSALYQVIVSVRGEGYEAHDPHRTRDVVTGALAVVYAVWLLYAAGPEYLVVGAILYLIGTALYLWARARAHQKLFRSRTDVVAMAVVLVASVWGVIGLLNGTFSIAP